MRRVLTPRDVREAIACGIGSMRERESLGILPKRYAEAQAILRRLLESGFVEAAMCEEDVWRKDYRNRPDRGVRAINESQSATHESYRRMQEERA